MPRQKYTLFWSFLSLMLTSFVQGQTLYWSDGGADTEAWDAIIPKDESLYIALGFRNETQLEGQSYFSEHRGVAWGKLTDSRYEHYGLLKSEGSTNIRGGAMAKDSLCLIGNAFSQLMYDQDTLLPASGRNMGFFLFGEPDGSFYRIRQLQTQGSVFPQAIQSYEENFYTLSWITDTVEIDGFTFIPNAEQANLILIFDPSGNVLSGQLIDGERDLRADQLCIHSNRLSIAGIFKGKVYAATDSFETRTADYDGFVIHFDEHLNEQWARHLKGVYEDEVNAIACNEYNVVLGGRYIGAIEFGDIQIIGGLRVSGFLGNFHYNGDAAWLYSMPGNNNLSGVEDILSVPEGWKILGWMGNDLAYRQDTLRQEGSFDAIHTYHGLVNYQGDLINWTVNEGDPRLYGQEWVPLEEQDLIAAEYEFNFLGEPSAGNFDLLLFEPREFSSFFVTLEEQQLLVVPNPAKDQIQIPAAFPGDSFVLLNSSGQVLQKGSWNDTFFAISHLPKGSYTLLLKRPFSNSWKKASFIKID